MELNYNFVIEPEMNRKEFREETLEYNFHLYQLS